ncbi:Co-activator protein [Lactococcus sp. DD01]|nr:Co-activator protein [Lactococcus sp. DD01]
MGPVKFMRIANPFRYCGIQSLKLYYEIEPETWGTEKLRGVYVAKLCMLPFAGFSA